VEGFWYIFFLGVVLKVPVIGAMLLVWWAVRAEPETEESPPSSDDHEFRRWRRSPTGPRHPRRGPHGGEARPLPECPLGARAHIAASPAQSRVGQGSH
jgi:hypothetical protein